jgi:hypothetical protein
VSVLVGASVDALVGGLVGASVDAFVGGLVGALMGDEVGALMGALVGAYDPYDPIDPASELACALRSMKHDKEQHSVHVSVGFMTNAEWRAPTNSSQRTPSSSLIHLHTTPL